MSLVVLCKRRYQQVFSLVRLLLCLRSRLLLPSQRSTADRYPLHSPPSLQSSHSVMWHCYGSLDVYREISSINDFLQSFQWFPPCVVIGEIVLVRHNSENEWLFALFQTRSPVDPFPVDTDASFLNLSGDARIVWCLDHSLYIMVQLAWYRFGAILSVPYRPFFRRPFFDAGPFNAGPNYAVFEKRLLGPA